MKAPSVKIRISKKELAALTQPEDLRACVIEKIMKEKKKGWDIYSGRHLFKQKNKPLATFLIYNLSNNKKKTNNKNS